MQIQAADRMGEPVLSHARSDFPLLDQDLTIAEALDRIRREGVGERIVYFYVVDRTQRLTGVLPMRKLLTEPLNRSLFEVMIYDVVTVPETATMEEAWGFFAKYKYLAFPVVDRTGHVRAVVDINAFTDQWVDAVERDRLNDVFEAVGLQYSQVKNASPLKAFRYRFPWLLTTIGSGTICAFLSGAYETTLAESLVIAFFLTLVTGLGESVSIQSMTVAIQALNTVEPTLKWYLHEFRREVGSATLLGLACGLLVAGIVVGWRAEVAPGIVIGGSILAALVMASAVGLSIPSLLHALRLDPKIAAGPVTLALTDVCVLLFYFSLASWMLGA